MVWILNGIWNPEAQSFEIQIEMSRFRMVGTISIAKAWPFKNRIFLNLIFKMSGFWMFRFQNPTVQRRQFSRTSFHWLVFNQKEDNFSSISFQNTRVVGYLNGWKLCSCWMVWSLNVTWKREKVWKPVFYKDLGWSARSYDPDQLKTGN